METTHVTDPVTGHLRQIVSPERLREILDESGDDYSRPADFGDADEWDVGDADAPNRAEQAVDGLNVTAAGGVVLVDDGHTKWICSEDSYDAAYAALAKLRPLKDDEDGGEAYSELCRRIGAPMAALDDGCAGGTQEARLALIRKALDADLIDDATARRMGLPE